MRLMKKVEAFAPATVANVGCGFDILGFAIHGPGDYVSASLNDSGEVKIKNITGTDKLPLSANENTSGKSVISLLKKYNSKIGVDLSIKKMMPIGSGLGSSSASSVASVVATNRLLGEPFTKKELLEFALDGEEIASGARHGDNVIPCLFGGLTMIHNPENFEFISLPVPGNLWILVIYQHIEIKTSYARQILPKEIPVKSAVSQAAMLGKFIAALYSENYSLIKGSFSDYIAEPHRNKLIPHYHELKSFALDAGALGFNISGSGPSVFAVFNDIENLTRASQTIKAYMSQHEINYTEYISQINTEGAKVIQSE